MGADGGFVAKRSDLVIPKAVSNDKYGIDRSALWTQCSLSHQRLIDPVVSDWNGSLYNKAAVLELLLGISVDVKPSNRITQLRDVVELKRELKNGQWIDPVSQKVLAVEGASESFAYLAECGHISAFSTIKMVRSCPVCEASFEFWVILNPQTAEARCSNKYRISQLEQRGLSNSLRPIKKLHQKRKSRSDNGESQDASDAGDKSSVKLRKLARQSDLDQQQ